MSGHTPGPWRLEKRDGVVTSQAESKVSRDDFPWKVVVPAPPFALGATGALIENEANARLIAAAPELLRELTHLRRCLHPWIESGHVIPGIATLNGADDAIAKATGADA